MRAAFQILPRPADRLLERLEAMKDGLTLCVDGFLGVASAG
jgi:hypothetical protein